MKLGEVMHIAIGVNDLSESQEFYQKLGFNMLLEENSASVMTDGSITILLSSNEKQSLGLIYYVENIGEKLLYLEKLGVDPQKHESEDGTNKLITLKSPDGIKVCIAERDLLNYPRPDLVMLDENDIANTTYPNPKCGVFGEYSCPVADLQKSIDYWKRLGYEAVSVNDQAYPWAILTDGMNILGLHQTNNFDHTAITYFAPDMGERIRRLNEDGVSTFTTFGNLTDISKAAVLTTPQGTKFYLFTI